MPQNNSQINKLHIANAILIPEVISLLNENHTVTIPLRGFSMRPFLEDKRDKALLKTVHDIKVGDVVLAEIKREQYVLHRIIAIKENDITLLGDGNLKPEYCKRSDIKGIAIGFYRKGKTNLDSTDNKKWQIYSWIWMRLYPIRRYLLFIHRKLFIK